MKRRLMVLGGWLAFGLGWIGVFLPGLPTTIFWILAALAFLNTNPQMYARIVSNRRFGPAIRLFVEEGKISGRGKLVSILMMGVCSAVGALAIPTPWVRILVVGAALVGIVWVWTLPRAEAPGPIAGPTHFKEDPKAGLPGEPRSP